MCIHLQLLAATVQLSVYAFLAACLEDTHVYILVLVHFG